MHLSAFSPRGGSGDTGGIRQEKNPNSRELDRTPRHGGGGKFDTLSGSSKLNYLTNLILDTTYLPWVGI